MTAAEIASFLDEFASPSPPAWTDLPRLFAEPGAATVCRPYLSQHSPFDSRFWAAMQVALRTDPAPATFAPLLTHSVAAVRLAAADGLLARGDRRGFPVLIAALTVTEVVTWRAASRALCRWTANGDNGPPLDGDDTQRVAGVAAWRGWWSANKAHLRFVDGTWEV